MSSAASTSGPRSPEGKATSSRNSLQHGLTAKEIVLPGEDPAAYEALRHSLIESHNPAQGLETILIDQISQCVWRLDRARRIERDVLEQELTAPEGSSSNRLEKVTRYMASIERELHRSIRELTALQANRTRAAATAAAKAADEEESSALIERLLNQYAPLPACTTPGPIEITKRTNPALRL